MTDMHPCIHRLPDVGEQGEEVLAQTPAGELGIPIPCHLLTQVMVLPNLPAEQKG